MGDGPNPNGKHSKYSVEDGELVRKGEFCPTCGPGVFLGVHEDRKAVSYTHLTLPTILLV